MLKRNLSRPIRILVASLLAAAGLSTVGAAPSHAEQFVLFDVMFDYTKMQADTSRPSQSHFYVKGNLINPARPTNWVTPVDYRNGTVHIRTEVIEKPAGGERTEWTLCYIPNRGQGNGYGCTGSGIYREKGLYERDESMTAWWENQSIIWTEGIKQMDLVIKDGSGGGGHAHKRPDHEKFFPTKMRITMVQVSRGATYDPSLVPNLGGLPPAPGAPSAAPDAGAGGAGGAAGGNTGAGGAVGSPPAGPPGGGSGPATPPPSPGAPGGPDPAPPAAPTPTPGSTGSPSAPAPAAPTPAPAAGGAEPNAGNTPVTPPAVSGGCVVTPQHHRTPGLLAPVVLGMALAFARSRRRPRR